MKSRSITPERLRSQLGASFVQKLVEPFLLGHSKDWLVREAKTGNFAAAKKLAKVLEESGITTPAGILKLDPLSLASQKGIGETTIYVLLCVQQALGEPKVWQAQTWRTHAKHGRAKKGGGK